MNMTRIIVLVAALGAAALAAFMARGFLGKKEPAANAAAMESIEVLVAAKNVNVGAKIALTDLKWQKWPKDALDEAYITKKTQPNAIDEAAAGSVARAPLLVGEPITAQKVIKADGAGFLAAVLTAGHRAYSLKVNAERGAGGFILPNDRVDVIMTRKLGNDDGGRPAFDSATVLQNVRVLAIDQMAKEEEGNQAIVGKTATLEVSPTQAQALALAEAMGDITLSLRSLAGDEGAQEAEVADVFNKRREDKVVIYRYGVRSQSAGQSSNEE
jgi:pilus assembly protein CpaB